MAEKNTLLAHCLNVANAVARHLYPFRKSGSISTAPIPLETGQSG
jgi:hypothetical protein